MYYSGIYYHSLDKKNRFFLPSKLRKSKARFVFTTPVVDKCIYLYPDDEWKKILLKFDNLQLKDKSQERAFKRIFLSSAEDAQVDPQGRLLIPKKLISEAKIDKKDSHSRYREQVGNLVRETLETIPAESKEDFL